MNASDSHHSMAGSHVDPTRGVDSARRISYPKNGGTTPGVVADTDFLGCVPATRTSYLSCLNSLLLDHVGLPINRGI